jgi:hypothetical protein
VEPQIIAASSSSPLACNLLIASQHVDAASFKTGGELPKKVCFFHFIFFPNVPGCSNILVAVFFASLPKDLLLQGRSN